MKQRPLPLVSMIGLVSSSCFADLRPLADDSLGSVTGQAGISIDMSVNGNIDQILYVDTDDGGRLGLKDVRISGATGNAVDITGMSIDVHGEEGLKIGFGKIGSYDTETHKYNALNVKIGDVTINDTSIGTFAVENYTNFITNHSVSMMNIMFGKSLTLNTAAGAAGKYIDGGLIIRGRPMDTVSGVSDGGLIIDAKIGGFIDKVAWIDSGHEMGLFSVGMFDTEGNEIVAMNQHLELDLVDHEQGGTALQISGLKMEGHIAIGSIYLGNPMNSLGSLMISGINMEETTLKVYAH
jgi:hypothetical protein